MKNSIVFILILLTCSCSYGEESHFDDYDELSKSTSMNGWIPFEVPKDARNIEIWRNFDTNSVRASFEHGGGFHGAEGYMEISDLLRGVAVSSYPEVREQLSGLKIFYQCESAGIVSPEGVKMPGGSREIRYIGEADEKVFYWNDSIPENYERVCSKGGGCQASRVIVIKLAQKIIVTRIHVRSVSAVRINRIGCGSLVITRHPGLGRGACAASVSGSLSDATSGSGTTGGNVTPSVKPTIQK